MVEYKELVAENTDPRTRIISKILCYFVKRQVIDRDYDIELDLIDQAIDKGCPVPKKVKTVADNIGKKKLKKKLESSQKVTGKRSTSNKARGKKANAKTSFEQISPNDSQELRMELKPFTQDSDLSEDELDGSGEEDFFSGDQALRAQKKYEARMAIIERKNFIEGLKMKGLNPPSCEFVPDWNTLIKLMQMTYTNASSNPRSRKQSRRPTQKKTKPKK
jgi:hypothetical protein